MQLTTEAISFGHAIYRAGTADKLAVVTTSHHRGLFRGGLGVSEPYPREQWDMHWTKPRMSVAEAQAVLDAIAKLPVDPAP